MLSEQREHLKNQKELQEKKKEKNLSWNKRFWEKWKMQDNSSSWIKKEDLQSKLSKKEMSFYELFRNKKK
jgi:hypothetical protein